MTSYIGSHRIYFPSCSSTNDIALQLARTGCESGTIVVADHQTAGKGRMGRHWESFRGSLALSVVLRPKISINQSSRLVVASALAVAQACEHFGARVFIKWPNDILIFHSDAKSIEKFGRYRKIAGILAEQIITQDKIDAAVVGIGVNLLRPEKGEFLPQIGFLQDVCENVDKTNFEKILLENLQNCFHDVNTDESYASLHERMKQRSLFIGKPVEVTQQNEMFFGIVEDIAMDGALVMRNKDATKLVYFGDVHLAHICQTDC